MWETPGAKRHDFEPKSFKNTERGVNILTSKIPRCHKYHRQYNHLSIPDLNKKPPTNLSLSLLLLVGTLMLGLIFCVDATFIIDYKRVSVNRDFFSEISFLQPKLLFTQIHTLLCYQTARIFVKQI